METHGWFNFATDTLQTAIYVLDEYVSKHTDLRGDQYQLAGITALFIACKNETVKPPSIEDLVTVAERAYSRDDVVGMEKNILRSIDFRINRPLPIAFLKRFSNLTQACGLNFALLAIKKFEKKKYDNF